MAEGAEDDTSPEGEERRRRRRRRGGRGRGRGRGQEQAAGAEGVPAGEAELADEELEAEEDEGISPPVRPAPRPAAFGSVWDSQIGVPSAPRATAPLDDEEYDDEPAIPEYLLAERRRGARGGAPQRPGQRGQRGRGGAYAAAVDRERFGGRGGSRLVEPVGRSGQGSPGGQRGGQRPVRAPQGAPNRDRAPERRSSAEPWSEVPPELEELLRAQLAHKLARQATSGPATRAPEAPAADAPAPKRRTTRRAPAAGPVAETAPAPTAEAPAPRRRTRRPAADVAAAVAPTAPEAPAAEAPAPKRPTRKAPPAARA